MFYLLTLRKKGSALPWLARKMKLNDCYLVIPVFLSRSKYIGVYYLPLNMKFGKNLLVKKSFNVVIMSHSRVDTLSNK